MHTWNPKSGGGAKSKLHKKAKIILKDCFPYDTIYEEVSLPGTKTSSRRSILRADFYIPSRNLIVEVNGEQHFVFNKFHYKDKLSFFRAQARDRDKKEWCNINEIRIIEFDYNEGEDDWRRKVS
jgi:hypothetical protein